MGGFDGGFAAVLEDDRTRGFGQTVGVRWRGGVEAWRRVPLCALCAGGRAAVGVGVM